jgi:hypothetical protein
MRKGKLVGCQRDASGLPAGYRSKMATKYVYAAKVVAENSEGST